MANETDAIISIHPQFAEAILDGEKTVELRRRIPALSCGDRLWIYATKPIGAVVGFATVDDITRGHPSTLWKQHRKFAGVDYEAFKSYFYGTQNGIGILLKSVKRIEPVSVEKIREIRGSFHPPQVMLKLSDVEGAALRSFVQLSA